MIVLMIILAYHIRPTIMIGPLFQNYKHLIYWLRDQHKAVQREYNLAEGLLTYVKLVVNSCLCAGGAGKPILELKEEFRKGFTKPSALFASWAKIIEGSTKSMDVQISVDAVVKTIFQVAHGLFLPKMHDQTRYF